MQAKPPSGESNAPLEMMEQSSLDSPPADTSATSGDEDASPTRETADAAEIVRAQTIRVLEERIRLLGINRSGAYDHYNAMLAKGFPIPAYEIAIVDLIRRRLPSLRSYHEIGSGLGTLPFMLAHEGFAAVGIERDDRRHLTATTILRALATQHPQIEGNCRLIGAAFPDAVADLDVSDSIAILTDFVATQGGQEYRKLCQGLARYRYVLVDLQRFCVKREALEEQEQLVAEFAKHGLVPMDEFIDLDTEGQYRLFKCTPRPERSESVGAARSTAGATLDAVQASRPQPRHYPLQPEADPITEVALAQPARLPERIAAAGPDSLPAQIVLPPLPQRARRRRFGGILMLSAVLVIGIPTLLAVFYYASLASDQFVTSFRFAVRGPSAAAAMRPGGVSTMGAGAMSPDAFVVTDYINSPQAIADLRRSVDLPAMFTRSNVDFLARLPAGWSAEDLNAYWQKMVSAQFDLITGNVSVSVRAFTPQDSLKLAQAVVVVSDQMFRRLNLKAQEDFVRVADDNLSRAEKMLASARQALVTFREQSGLVDPDRTAQAGAAIVDDLRKQLAGLQAQYASMRSLTPSSLGLAALRSQIAALEVQIKSQEKLGASPLKAVTAEALGKYQSLDLERQFAEKQYIEALALRSQAYLTALNQQSYLALFVEPALAQQSLYPNRVRAIVTVFLAAAALWFIGMLITYAIRDHLM